MNPLIERISHLMNNDLPATPENTPPEPSETAAVPGQEESKPLHPGKRRIKEVFTSHWDLDYLPRDEVDRILREAQPEKES